MHPGGFASQGGQQGPAPSPLQYPKCTIFAGTVLFVVKVRLRWFGADLVKLQYLCHLSWDLNVLYIK